MDHNNLEKGMDDDGVPNKRRKTYLELGGTEKVPKTTMWRKRRRLGLGNGIDLKLNGNGLGLIGLDLAAADIDNRNREGEDVPNDAENDNVMQNDVALYPPINPYECTGSPNSRSYSFNEDDGEELDDAVYHDDESDIADYPDSDSDEVEYHDDSDDANASDDSNDLVELGNDLNQIIFERSQMNRGEALLAIVMHSLRFSLPYKAIISILNMFNLFAGQKVFPQTKYLYKKYFKNSLESIKYHFYCGYCYNLQASLRKKNLPVPKCNGDAVVKCLNCNKDVHATLSKGQYFLTVDLKSSISQLLKEKEIGDLLMMPRLPSDGTIRDITDSELYRVLTKPGNILNNNNNFSYNFNTDGANVFQSSKNSMWPILFTINELPPKIRFKTVLLAGLWFGKQEPKMELFMQTFVDDARKLATTGIVWRASNDVIIRSCFVPIACCVDSVARAKVQNVKQYNGKFGCSLCLHPGILVNRVIKYPMTNDDYDDRTEESALRDAQEVLQTGQRDVRGVKGPSCLLALPNFNVIWGCPPDYLHCVLLGVVRQWFELMVNDPVSSLRRPNNMMVVEERLKNIKPPSTIHRSPRPLSERRNWKASEWKSWLLFYVIPCLRGIVETRYLSNIAFLVKGIQYLLSTSITADDLYNAETSLLSFVASFQALFGEEAMTFNVHMMTHLVKSVRLSGPLWSTSTFPYESYNFDLRQLVHGPKGVMQQIVEKSVQIQHLPEFCAKFGIHEHTENFCKSIMNPARVKSFTVQNGVTLLGTGDLLDRELQLLFPTDDDPSTIYNRCIKDGVVFHSRAYDCLLKTRDSFVKLTDNTFAEIISIVVTSEDCLLLVKKINTQHLVVQNTVLNHIYEVLPENIPIQVVNISSVLEKCVYVATSSIDYICCLPNNLEIQ